MNSPILSEHEKLSPSEAAAPAPAADPPALAAAAGEPQSRRRVIAKRYRVDQVLAEGGMAVVYRGWHLPLDEPIAIKILKPEFADNEEAVTRFLQEARAGALLRGKNVAQVLDIGRLESGPPFMVTQLLKGHDLQELLEAHGRLPVSTTLRLAKDICTAIADVHQSGIVHRDLKPANIFIAHDGSGEPLIKLLDFGIAKRLDGHDLNDTKDSLGSPHYMAPEQIMTANAVDAQADIWSLGIVLFELLTGRVPFDADTVPAQCAQVLNSPCPIPSELVPEIPPALDAIILRCLEKDPRARFASALELRTALEEYDEAAPPAAETELDVPITVCEPAPEAECDTPIPLVVPGAHVREVDARRKRGLRLVAAAMATCACVMALSFSSTRDAAKRAYGATEAVAHRSYSNASRALAPSWFHDKGTPERVAPKAPLDADERPAAASRVTAVSAARPEPPITVLPAPNPKPVVVKRVLPLKPPPRPRLAPVPAPPPLSLGQHPDPVERRYALTENGNTTHSQDLINPYPDMPLK